MFNLSSAGDCKFSTRTIGIACQLILLVFSRFFFLLGTLPLTVAFSIFFIGHFDFQSVYFVKQSLTSKPSTNLLRTIYTFILCK